MKRTNARELAIMVALIAITVGLRLYFRHIPNFAPVAAVALFAGFFFQSRWVAITVPLASMWLTDQLLGGYQPLLMLTVYSFLALPVLMSGWFRRSFTTATAWGSTLSILCCTLAASVLFFVVTNFVTWWVTPWYPPTLSGLWQCYLSAVPFFRYTLAGDVFFATSMFGTYAAVMAWKSRQAQQQVAAAA